MVVFNTLAQKAARKHGVIDFKGLLARLHRNIGVEIWRRAASMLYDCMPKFYDREEEFLNVHSLPGLLSDADIAAVVRCDASNALIHFSAVDGENPYPGSGRLNTSTLP